MLKHVPEYVQGSIESVSAILVTASRWVAVSVNFESTMDRDIVFTLVVLVKKIVLLLCGGTKRNQGKDNNLVKEYWYDYKKRKKE